jgi:hypothetical protein
VTRDLRDHFVVTKKIKDYSTIFAMVGVKKYFYLMIYVQNVKLFKMTLKSGEYNDPRWRKLQHIRRDQFWSRSVTTFSGHDECAAVFSTVDHYILDFFISF